MTTNDEGSTIMTHNTSQNHTNKQPQLFQPGSPNKRKNNNSTNTNISSPNSNQRRKRKQPRSLPRQSQQLQRLKQLQQLQQTKHLKLSSKKTQLSLKENEKQNNHTENISNTSQHDSNMNDWKLNFDDNKNKKNSTSPKSIKHVQTESFGKFFETLTTNNSPKETVDPSVKDKNVNSDDNSNKMSMFIEQNNSNTEDDIKNNNEHDANDQISISNLLQSQYSSNNNDSHYDNQFNDKRAPFIEVFDDMSQQKVIDLYTEQLTGIFDELDMEICATQQNISNNNQSDSTTTSPIMLKYQNNNSDNEYNVSYNAYNDDYKQQIQYQNQNKKKKIKKSRKIHTNTRRYPNNNSHNNTNTINVSPVSDINIKGSMSNNKHNTKHCYIHPNGKKMSDESFKLMQQCLNGLEMAKCIAKEKNTMHQLSKIQDNICKKMKVKHKNDDANNSDEKMSMDISPSYSIQSPHQQQQQQQQQQHNYNGKKKTAKHKYCHTNYNQTGNMNNNYSFNNKTVTNINIVSNQNNGHNVRRQLSFGSSHSHNTDLLQYDYGMSSPEIIEKQKQKIYRTNQEMVDLQHELNCVYNTLNAVQKNRNKLFNDVKSMRKEYSEQIKSIHRQYNQFKQQTNLFQKEQREIEHEIQQQNKYQQDLSSINVSPAKSSNKSNRKQQYYQYKR